MEPGTILLHERGRAVAIVGDDGNMHTHNMSFRPHPARKWTVIARGEVPEHLLGYLDAAERRAASDPHVWGAP